MVQAPTLTPPDIVFDPVKHTYHVNGELTPSVTQILGVLNKPALTWWGQGIGVQGVCQLRKNGEEIPWDDPDGILSLLTHHKLTVNHVTKRRGDSGSSVHRAAEAYAQHGTVPNVADFPREDWGYVAALAKALLELDPEVIETEQIVASVQHGFAGTYDLLANVAGKLVRLDYKTSKRVYPESHFPQLEAYEAAAVEMGGQASDARGVLLLCADGSWSLTWSTATFEDFLGIKAAFDAVQRIKAATRKATRG